MKTTQLAASCMLLLSIPVLQTRALSLNMRFDRASPLSSKLPFSRGNNKVRSSFNDPSTERRIGVVRQAFRTYQDYTRRLWNETAPEVRKGIAKDKVASTIRQLQDVSRSTSYLEHDVSETSLQNLEEACNKMLVAIQIEKAEIAEVPGHEDKLEIHPSTPTNSTTTTATSEVGKTKKKKGRRSIWRGVVMGACVAAWVFSGNYVFTGLFTLMTIVGQLEYYRMVMNTGVYPARRISVVGAASMFLTALFAPSMHQICLPAFGTYAMIWFLTMRRSVATIPEIATTFTGMFYLGYVPSFWVRIRTLGVNPEPTRVAAMVAPMLKFIHLKSKELPAWLPQAVHLPITSGAIFVFWTWLCLAFSDVGAYFVGKSFGKTKLGKLCPAAGQASPNKTVEGVIGGCAVSAMLAILGAWVQRWPCFVVTGAIHGVMLGLLGLLGDLTASLLKRDAGLKDFGDLIPEHGGVLDRVDSFVWSAPYSWLVYSCLLPLLRNLAAP